MTQNEQSPVAVRLRGFNVWCRHQESNSGPTDYKSVALPAELCRLTDANYIDGTKKGQQAID